jgi:hypothetical protein
MTRAECRAAIEGPAGVCAFSIEPQLVSRLLNDLSDFAPWEDQAVDRSSQASRLLRRADQLPLLQHALNRLWIRAARGDNKIILTLKDYLEIGGLRGAIDRHADEVIEGLGTERLPIVERIFRALTDGSTVADAVRRPTKLSDLAAAAEVSESEVRAVIEPFLAQGCNFLTKHPPGPLTSETFIDISHESLIRQWSRLSRWLQAEVHSAESIRRIDAAATRHTQGQGDFLQGLDLANLLEWQRNENPTPAWAGRYVLEPTSALKFLEESHAQEEKKRLQEEKKRRQAFLLRAATASLVLFALLAAGALVFEMEHGRALDAQRSVAIAARNEAQEQREKAEASRIEAQAQRDKAEAARVDAQSQRDKAEAARSEADAARVDAQMQRDKADAARKEADEVLRQARGDFLSSARAQADELQSAGNYSKAGDFLAAVVGATTTASGEVDRAVLDALIPRLVEQIAVGSAFYSDAEIWSNRYPVKLHLDRPGRFEARTDEDATDIELIDGETGLRHAHLALENAGKIDTKAHHYVSRDGSAMIVVGDGGQLFLWLAGDDVALFVPDPAWLGRRPYSYAYDSARGIIAALYCQFGTSFLGVTSRDGRFRLPPRPLFELSGDLSPSIAPHCPNDVANPSVAEKNGADTIEQLGQEGGAARNGSQLVFAAANELTLVLAEETVDGKSSGLVAYNPKKKESRWLVAPGRLQGWSETLDNLLLVVSMPRGECSESLSLSALAASVDEKERELIACLVSIVPARAYPLYLYP